MDNLSSQSYSQFIALLERSRSRFHKNETALLRAGADALFFDEEDASAAKSDAEDMLAKLQENGRLSQQSADTLRTALNGCEGKANGSISLHA